MRGTLSSLIGLWIWVGASLPGNAAELSIAADEEKRGGALLEITRLALQRAGHSLRVSYLPWARALRESLDGQQYDLLLGVYYSAERAEKLHYSEPLARADLYLFGLRSRQLRYRNLADLAPYRIGIIRGAIVNDVFSQASYLHLDEATDPASNVRKLLAGRIDLFIDQRRAIDHLLRSQFANQTSLIEAIEPPLQVHQFYNAFPKARPGAEQLRDDFNRGLRAIIADGSYSDIMRRYPHD